MTHGSAYLTSVVIALQQPFLMPLHGLSEKEEVEDVVSEAAAPSPSRRDWP